MDPSDQQLLKEFLARNSEQAFRTLTERHLPLVHSTARRVTGNDEAARDVAQTVFLKLARRAARIPRDLPLTAWFHRETHSASVDHVRSEVRRQRREQTAADLTAMKDEPGTWTDLAPVIDGAIDSLPEKDRSVVLLRFYENKSHPEIARDLGIREDAARMRTNRALEKLRRILRKRGITTSAALLAATLPVHAVTAPPVTLAATISTAATATIAGTTSTTTATTTLSTLIAMTKANIIAIATVVIVLPIIGLQQNKLSTLKQENASLRTASTTPLRNKRDPRSQDLTAGPGHETRDHLGRDDTPTDLRDILAQTDPMSRIRSLLAYVDGLKPEDIPGALAEIRKGAPEWDPEGRMLTHMLLTRWAQDDPDAAFASLADLDFKKTGGDPNSILAGLAAQDPKRAADWLNNPDNSLVQYPMMGHILAGTIAKEWVRQDAEAALAWAETLPESQRAGAYSGVLGSLATTDPLRASTLAMKLESGEARQHIVGEVARAWARTAPTDALAWAQSLEGDDQQQATREALGTWAQADPAAAAKLVDGMTGQEPFDSYLTTVASTWAPQAPGEAAAWVTTQAEGQGKNQAMGHVMWNWTTRDPESAANWLAEQPVGAARDAGIGGLAKAAFDFDPGGALTWATDIDNEGFRGEAVEIGLREWMKRDPERARQWANQNDVPTPSSQDLPKDSQPD